MFMSSVSTSAAGSIAFGASVAYTFVSASSGAGSAESMPSLVALVTSSLTASSYSATCFAVRMPSSRSRFLKRSRQSFSASVSISSWVR